MEKRQGSLSIHSENIFPIIKKWMYSDQDIFIREMISNACDAITKLSKLEVVGAYDYPADYKPRIDVLTSSKDKTLTFIDNGIGMTADEVEEYITQIAFSGATEFLDKYKDKTNADQIIGHFGLGFYSAFMVADEVHIDTLSFKEGATPVHWSCDGGTTYEMSAGSKDTIGTKITLFLNEDCLEYANIYRVREVLNKYCSFMPTEIFLKDMDAEEETEIIDEKDLKETDKVLEHIHEDARMEEKTSEDGTKEMVETSPAKDTVKIVKREEALNDTEPLWTKHPGDCTDEEYIAFYRKVFMDYKEPLFWIHLNMDYPFNLKGILYFPKINMEYETIEGKIKLYNNQVFIADNIKEVIPEFLLLLKGVIDCPDMPLNVSRSALQNDGFATKISDYISKKVADKLTGMCKVEREDFEKYWDDISPFVKFGCLKDPKFCDRMSESVLFKNLDHKYFTLKEMVEKLGGTLEKPEGTEEVKDEDKTVIFYVTDEKQQSQYVNFFKAQGQEAVILPHNIDSPFIGQLEMRNEMIRFMRIDADLSDSFKEAVSEEEKDVMKTDQEKIQDVFRKALNKETLVVNLDKLKDASLASVVTVPEEARRMQDMMKMYGMYGMEMPEQETPYNLTLNYVHPLVKYVLAHEEGDTTTLICQQLFDLARMANEPLKEGAMAEFVSRSNEILMRMAKED